MARLVIPLLIEKAIVTVQTVAMHILVSNSCSQPFAISDSCLAAQSPARSEPPSTTAKKTPTLPANTMHPHRVWSRTANGGLQYTGMLSSDC